MKTSISVRRTPVSLALGLLLSSLAATGTLAQTASNDDTPRATEDKTRLGTIIITGQGDRFGAGQMLNEDAAKGRSSVTKQSIEKDRSTGNPYQGLALLPGMNTYNNDATGLFGGGLTLRGFDSSQLGVTVNGVPVNDSGNFAVFPQEYVDNENLCILSVAQGSSDQESPNVGASGGGLNITTCDPEDKRRVKLSQTVGQLNLSRTFIRVDTGKFASDMGKAFVSYSHSEADKWKGLGSAKRDHIDSSLSLDVSPGNKIIGTVLYNRAINNNILSPSLAQLNANGYNYDYAPTYAGYITPVAGTAQKATASPVYYGLSSNPFENVIASISGAFKLAENTQLKVQPYLWYGYGTGGNQQKVISESAFLNSATGKLTSARDLNGDGDTLDTVTMANSSVTRTRRPGITTELTHTVGIQTFKFGFWYERATHLQTGPAVPVDANGNSSSVWLTSNQILRPDGSQYQSRDWKTTSTAMSAFANDTISLMDDQLTVQFGLKLPKVTRDFTNNASEGSNSQIPYNISRSFSMPLPQAGLRFNLDPRRHVFASIGKTFRAPPNSAFAPSSNNISVVNGVASLKQPIEAETSVNTELGYRFQGSAYSFSATVFNMNFSNRQINSFDPNTLLSIYTNAGGVINRGLELELGTRPVSGFTYYGSLSLQKSRTTSDLSVGKGQLLPITGKAFPLAPEVMLGSAVQWTSGPMYARLKGKYTGKQFATLMNDEEVPAYTVFDLDAGYAFGQVKLLGVQNLQLRGNISNIFNKQYRNPSAGSIVNNAQAVNGIATSGTVFYYLGSPRFASVTLSGEF